MPKARRARTVCMIYVQPPNRQVAGNAEVQAINAHFPPNAMLDKGRNVSSAIPARQAPFRWLTKDLGRAWAFRHDGL
jgi:hypothetical protein